MVILYKIKKLMTRKASISDIIPETEKNEDIKQLEEEKYQIGTSDQGTPVYRDEDTSEARNIETKEL